MILKLPWLSLGDVPYDVHLLVPDQRKIGTKAIYWYLD